ncbi:MAG: acyltransferase [Lachnospiraceae bacterium]|nr:acyltransferase [Lachnospiraceae bacterium]
MRIKWFAAVRAYGLFLVLGYHLFYDYFPGGFLGVDIFFTFSGFLITALIIEEVWKRDLFALFKFYKRRAQRILIPLYLAVIFTLPFLLLASPDLSVGITKQVSSALGLVMNWMQIVTGGSYESSLLPQVYIHTWSLALEMQFYLVWGLICAVLALFAKAIFADESKKVFICFRSLVLIVSGIFAVCSYLYLQNMYNSDVSLDAIYFNTFARSMPFFIGSFAAAIWGVEHQKERTAGWQPKHIKLAVFGAIIITLGFAAVIFYDSIQYKFADEFIYHYGFLLTSLLTVGLIYGTHALHCLTPPEKDEPRLLRGAADVSYDAYLFHWPLYVVFSTLFINNLIASLVTLTLTFILSALMFYKAERVFIPSGHESGLKNKGFVTAVVTGSLVVALILNAVVLFRAPAITSIETDFAISYVKQDADNIAALERKVQNISGQPVLYDIGRPLIMNLLTESEAVSAPEPNLTQTETVEQVPEVLAPPPEPAPLQLSVSGGVTVIGDSVPLGAAPAMQDLIPDCVVEAEVGRPVRDGNGILTDLQNRGELREFVVIALGTNGANNYEKLFNEMIETLNPGHKLIFVTPFDGRANDNSKLTNATAEWMRGLPDTYDFITIADWNNTISSQVNLLASDKVHMGGKSSSGIYANCVADAINSAAQKPAK